MEKQNNFPITRDVLEASKNLLGIQGIKGTLIDHGYHEASRELDRWDKHNREVTAHHVQMIERLRNELANAERAIAEQKSKGLWDNKVVTVPKGSPQDVLLRCAEYFQQARTKVYMREKLDPEKLEIDCRIAERELAQDKMFISKTQVDGQDKSVIAVSSQTPDGQSHSVFVRELKKGETYFVVVKPNGTEEPVFFPVDPKG